MAVPLGVLCNYDVSLRSVRKKRKRTVQWLINAIVIYVSVLNGINTKCINIIKGILEVVLKAF